MHPAQVCNFLSPPALSAGTWTNSADGPKLSLKEVFSSECGECFRVKSDYFFGAEDMLRDLMFNMTSDHIDMLLLQKG